MKVFFDYQAFTITNYGGISRYFSELIKYYHNFSRIEVHVSLNYSNNQNIKDLYFKNVKTFFPNLNFLGKVSLMLLLNKKYSSAELKTTGFDVFHPTYYDPYFQNFLGGKPFIITVHDMIHEMFPDNFGYIDNTIKNKRKLIQRANRIIAVSQKTKRDIIQIAGVDGDKIEVVYHGTSLPLFRAETEPRNLPEKYMLYVGDRRLYKNFSLFLKAANELIKKDKDLFLVCAGGKPFSFSEKRLISSMGLKNRVLRFEINDNLLLTLYRNARAFVFPSLYEGFGIPVLEAFAANCPVVLSETGALPEVADAAAVYFNPRDLGAITESVSKVIYNEKMRKKLITDGARRLKDFSWEKTAKQTEIVYQSVI